VNRLFKALGFRDRVYRGSDFSVRVKPVFREVVSVIHTRQGTTLTLNGEMIGKKWEGIALLVPEEIDPGAVSSIVSDLELAFVAMGYGYVISRKAGTDIVPKNERQAAMAELNEMGYEIEVLPNGQIRQSWRSGAPRRDIETLRKQTPRMMVLLQNLHGTRQRLQVLAKSKEF
jgi:hypothetical protein